MEMFVPSMRPLLNWRVDALAASDDAALAPPRIECTLIWLQHAEGGETLQVGKTYNGQPAKRGDGSRSRSLQATSSHDQIVRHMARGMVLNDTGVINGALLRQRDRRHRSVGPGSASAMSGRCRGMVLMCHFYDA